MKEITLTINDKQVKGKEGDTVLEICQANGVYIPTLCWHPDLPSFGACRLCIVEIEGVRGFPISCTMPARESMVVHTNTPKVQKYRRELLALLLSEHPHICLTCPQREGCDLMSCSSNTPVDERCCAKFTHCELREVAEYIGINEDIPRYIPKSLPIQDGVFFTYNPNLCILCGRCVRMCQDVRGAGVLNFAERGVNRIVTRAFEKSFMESGCKFCLSCVEVCPTGALMDKGKWEGPPCQPACPAGIDIPRYVRFIAEGRFAEALAVIREKVPFPAVLGRICDHPCEDECQRGKLNEPIAIRALKRFVSEHDAELWKANIHLHTSTGKRVAIIGSGPAGLTTAYYLAKLGHSITVFEASAEPGGMMQVGIPEYRLPKAIVKREIEQIKNVGVDIKTNTKVESIAQLSQQGYDAIFIAIGAHRDGDMGVEGENSPGVIGGLSFLKSLNLLGRGEIGKDVAVIGGTHTALDTARTARRLGAEEVSIFCPQTKINAGSEQIERAIEEGVKISYLVNVKKIVSVQPPSVTLSEAKGLGDSSPSAQNDSMGEQKINRQNGKLKVEFTSVEGGFTTDFDNVINAVNQEPEGLEGWGLSLNKGNTIEVDPNTLASNKEGVFAGGDVVTGPATVIQAIAMGRKVASSIDRYLGGEGNIDEELVKPEKPSLYIGRDEHFAERNRVEPPCLSVEERIKNFNEVELGLNQDKAIEEAKRCLRCDLRLLISSPPLPPKPWLKFDAETIATIPEVEGVYQLLDEDKNIIYIKGAMNLREELSEQLETNEEAAYLLYKEDPMYTSRESELIQQFLQKYGRLPEQNAGGLEDLF